MYRIRLDRIVSWQLQLLALRLVIEEGVVGGCMEAANFTIRRRLNVSTLDGMEYLYILCYLAKAQLEVPHYRHLGTGRV